MEIKSHSFDFVWQKMIKTKLLISNKKIHFFLLFFQGNPALNPFRLFTLCLGLKSQRGWSLGLFLLCRWPNWHSIFGPRPIVPVHSMCILPVVWPCLQGFPV
jgi:hypothetical protein